MHDVENATNTAKTAYDAAIQAAGEVVSGFSDKLLQSLWGNYNIWRNA